jgi:hypothetical protein
VAEVMEADDDDDVMMKHTTPTTSYYQISRAGVLPHLHHELNALFIALHIFEFILILFYF